MITQTPSTLTVEALVPSTLITLSRTVSQQLFDRHHGWERVGRRIAELQFIERELREHELLCLTPLQRYEKFRRERPQLLNIIPQYLIASYLGITPVSLSRIRARVVKSPAD